MTAVLVDRIAQLEALSEEISATRPPGLRAMAELMTRGAALLPGDRYTWIALSNTTLATLIATIGLSVVLIALPDIFRGTHIHRYRRATPATRPPPAAEHGLLVLPSRPIRLPLPRGRWLGGTYRWSTPPAGEDEPGVPAALSR